MASDTTPATDARKEQKESRIRMVRKLMLRGYKEAEDIKAALHRLTPPVDVTIRSIYRYKGIIAIRNAKAINAKEGLNKTIEEIAFEIKENLEEISMELWRQYHSTQSVTHTCIACGKEQKIRIPSGPSYKVQALKEIRETTEKQLEIMQSLGLITKAPEKTQIIGPDGKPVASLVNVDRIVLNSQFISFIKAKYQNPTAVKHEIAENTAEVKIQKPLNV